MGVLSCIRLLRRNVEREAYAPLEPKKPEAQLTTSTPPAPVVIMPPDGEQ